MYKNSLWLLAAASIVVGLTAPVLAQEQVSAPGDAQAAPCQQGGGKCGGGGKHKGGRHGKMRQHLKQKFDANHDGQLDEGEKAQLRTFVQQERERLGITGGGGGGRRAHLQGNVLPGQGVAPQSAPQ